jgi:hypothetical protein
MQSGSHCGVHEQFDPETVITQPPQAEPLQPHDWA